MYATGYHVPDPLRPIDPRLAGSLSRADPYASPHNAWQHPAPAQYRDLPPIPTASGQQRVPSPLSSPSIPSGDSPDAYFAPHHHFHHQHQLPHQHPQDGQWTQMSAHQPHPMPGPYIDNGYAPQVKAEASSHNPPLDALYAPEHGHGYMQDPSHFSLDQYTQGMPPGMNGGGAPGSSVGPDRNRPRAARQAAAKRTGACARCRRLKMKCTFTNPEDEICSRCNGGGYECVFPGRKPRAPGMRMVLRQQIREKDAMIDNLLSRVNPGPTMATPLTLVPARLPLSSKERTEYRDILSYLERAAQQAGQRVLGDGRARFDISALEDIISEEDSDTDEDMANVAAAAAAGGAAPQPGDGAASPVRGSSVERAVRPVESILEAMAPTGIMASAALQSNRAAASAMPDDSSTDSAHSHESKGVAGESYFLPGPQANLQLRRLIVERQAAPDILLSGLVTPEDVTALFEIHYKYINPIIPILDENIHSPASVLARCPFLFTVICTVASRYYKEKPHIYGMAIHFAKAAAANAVIDGWKTVEMCQAFALWSVYNPPARRWEEDRAWCYTGIAFRIATELNLSRIPEPFADERQERESHNRTRMWLMCFIMDRCLSIQSGKAWMVQEDATIRNTASWLHNFKYHNQCDGYLTSLTELLIIMSRFVGTVNPAFGTSSVESIDEIDFAALYKAYDDELMAWKAVIDERHRGEKKSSDPAIVMEITLVHCVFHYCRLVICCCGMQLMTKNKAMKPNELFGGCLQAATSLVKLMVEDFVPSGFVPYFPELVYVHSAFAAVVLLKCLRPEYNAYLDIQQEERIIELVQRLFTVWTSDKFSLDERHNTQLYAKFLKQLMEPHVARLAMKKRAASVFGRDAPSPAPPAQGAPGSSAHDAGSGPASAPTPAGSDVSSCTAAFSVKAEHPPVSPTAHSGSSGSASNSPVFPHHIPAAAASLGVQMEDLYATDVDISKEASQLAAAAGMIPPDMNMENVPWEQLMAAGTSLGGGLGDALGGMMGGMLGAAGLGSGGGATDWNGMSGDECLAAMMGLGDSTWFLTANPGGS
ncbi:hypothetical protein V8D89_005297 [Ganoderma adspersum]